MYIGVKREKTVENGRRRGLGVVCVGDVRNQNDEKEKHTLKETGSSFEKLISHGFS